MVHPPTMSNFWKRTIFWCDFIFHCLAHLFFDISSAIFSPIFCEKENSAYYITYVKSSTYWFLKQHTAQIYFMFAVFFYFLFFLFPHFPLLTYSITTTFDSTKFEFWRQKSAKRSMGMDTFYGDTFDNGFGSFETVKRAHPQSKPLYRCESINFHLKIESKAMF